MTGMAWETESSQVARSSYEDTRLSILVRGDMSDDRDNKKQEICPCLIVNVRREFCRVLWANDTPGARMAV